MIVYRYLKKEVLVTTAAVTSILLLVFLSNQFVRFLSRAAMGQFPGTVVFKLLMLQIPQLFGLLLPLGLFLAILVVYGRLYVDSEMTVFAACGISRKQILGMSLKVGVIVMAVVAVFVLFVSPAIRSIQDRVVENAKAASIVETIIPGRFMSSPDGRRVYYVSDITRDREHLQQIFVAEQPKGGGSEEEDPWNVLLAKQGYQQTDPDTGDVFLVTKDGYQYRGTPGEKDFRIVKFGEYGVNIDNNPVAAITPEPDAQPIWQLLKPDGNRGVMAELQWRLSMPLSVLLLVLLAVPLSRVKPREGRYAKLVPSILIYVIYANLLFMARSWIEKGTVSGWVGMWWVHIALAVVAVFYLAKEFHWWQRWQRRRFA